MPPQVTPLAHRVPHAARSNPSTTTPDRRLRCSPTSSSSFEPRFRRFAEREIAPHAAEADERSEYPWKSFEAYRDSGFVRARRIPEEYGGDGADTLAYALLVEEVARVCGSSSLFVLISRLA